MTELGLWTAVVGGGIYLSAGLQRRILPDDAAWLRGLEVARRIGVVLGVAGVVLLVLGLLLGS